MTSRVVKALQGPHHLSLWLRFQLNTSNKVLLSVLQNFFLKVLFTEELPTEELLSHFLLLLKQ